MSVSNARLTTTATCICRGSRHCGGRGGGGSRRVHLRVAAVAGGDGVRGAGSGGKDLSRRSAGAFLLAGISPLFLQGDATASGIESYNLMDIPRRSEEELENIRMRQKQAIQEADTTFENSELLATLRARSEANKDKNKKELEKKYCMRQAELGVGDCGGLRYIPGATKNGKQKTPKWLQNLLGVDLGDQDVDLSF